MKQQIKKLHQAHRQGNNAFTIIEVMIVLAIAGIIMVIVFLAIPALQRNSRNTQRTSDATRTAAAVDECLANNNSAVATCSVFGAGQLANYVTLAENQQLTGSGAITVSAMTLAFGGNKCNAAGSGLGLIPGGAGSFTIQYQIETKGPAVNRCIGS